MQIRTRIDLHSSRAPVLPGQSASPADLKDTAHWNIKATFTQCPTYLSSNGDSSSQALDCGGHVPSYNTRHGNKQGTTVLVKREKLVCGLSLTLPTGLWAVDAVRSLVHRKVAGRF